MKSTDKYLKDDIELLFGKRDTFIDFCNEKYKEEAIKYFNKQKFTTWDDYALWLYYIECEENEKMYYSRLEDDIKEFSDNQTKGVEEDYTSFIYLNDKIPRKWDI